MDNIVNSIVNYFTSDKREGAFQIKGEWGSGKTFFVKDILPHRMGDCKRIQVMISLFGIGGVKNIPYRLLNAYINKKCELNMSVSEDMDRGLDYLDMKYGEERKLAGINLHDEDELIYNIIPKDEVYICLDDVERFLNKDNVEELMGYVNNLVENIGYKVIVISNDNYYANDSLLVTIKNHFTEKVIGKAVTFVSDTLEVLNSIVDTYNDDDFKTFMERDDIAYLFMPINRNKKYRKYFENVRNMKYAISHFKVVFDHYKDSHFDEDTIKKLKYYLAFIIGVTIEYKKGILTEDDCHGIDNDIELFSMDSIDDDGILKGQLQDMLDDMVKTTEEKERIKRQNEYNDVYRRNFYQIYAKDVNQTNVFHEELYNSIIKGSAIDYEKLEMNIQKKVFDKMIIDNPGNVIVSQTLDGKIFDDTDEKIKEKLLVLLDCVKHGGLLTCAAYINAFSFLDMYRTVIEISHGELLEIFMGGFSTYISSHEIDNMERTSMDIVSEQIPHGTNEFYEFLQNELRNKWDVQYQQGLENMIARFNEDIPAFCKLFEDNEIPGSSRYKTEAVLQNIPEYMVEEKMHSLSPKDVHELAKLIVQRFRPEDIYAFNLAKEKQFLLSMKKGIEAIDGENKVSKVEAKRVLLVQIDKALQYFDIGRKTNNGQ